MDCNFRCGRRSKKRSAKSTESASTITASRCYDVKSAPIHHWPNPKTPDLHFATMSEDDQTLATIRDFIRTNFPLVRERNLTDDDSLLEGAIVDSLGVLDIVSFLEAKFSIEISDEDLVADSFETINSITILVQQKMCAAKES